MITLIKLGCSLYVYMCIDKEDNVAIMQCTRVYAFKVVSA